MIGIPRRTALSGLWRWLLLLPLLSAQVAVAAPDRQPRYLLASAADLVSLLPPPPPPDSAAQREDLAAVLAAQHAALADGGVAHATADAQASCARFADAAGTALTAAPDAGVLTFLDEAAREAAALVGPAKRYWKRERPFAVSNRVERLGDMAPDYHAPDGAGAAAREESADRDRDRGRPGREATRSTPERAAQERAGRERQAYALVHSSYPSGHATYGTVCAILLAEMVPERRGQIFARNLDYGHSRMVLGAHFPSDLAAGRIAGTVAAELLWQNALFREDFAAARAQLRSALNLPTQMPDLEPAAADAAGTPADNRR